MQVGVVLIGISERRGTGGLEAIALPAPPQRSIIALIADKRAGEVETRECGRVIAQSTPPAQTVQVVEGIRNAHTCEGVTVCLPKLEPPSNVSDARVLDYIRSRQVDLGGVVGGGVALTEGNLAEALAVKCDLRPALVEKVAALFVVLAYFRGFIRSNCDFNSRA